ncbi:MAG: ribonuclease III [Thermomicrobiales bacterium]
MTSPTGPAGAPLSSPATGPIPSRLPDAAADQAFARNTKVVFRDPLLLRLALTHRSVLHDWVNVEQLDATLQSNERLEFLGDALLGVIVGEYLYHADPVADEGTLTRRRAAIVRAETLVVWARELEMPEYLYLGTGESVTESVRDRMLAGGFEALVGAIYLDRGREVAERFVLEFLRRDSAQILANEEQTNPKGSLQEVMQDRFGVAPEYETIAAEGPDHARQFTVAVVLNGEHIGVGLGRSKREAQQAAAREALIALDVTGGSSTVSEAGDDAPPAPLPTTIASGHDKTVRVLKQQRALQGSSGTTSRPASGFVTGRFHRRLRGSGKR